MGGVLSSGSVPTPTRSHIKKRIQVNKGSVVSGTSAPAKKYYIRLPILTAERKMYHV